MKEYLTAVVSPLLSDPQALVIDEREDERGKLYSINVSKRDMGVIIGKGGATASAIRLLAHINGSRHQELINVRVVDHNI